MKKTTKEETKELLRDNQIFKCKNCKFYYLYSYCKIASYSFPDHTENCRYFEEKWI